MLATTSPYHEKRNFSAHGRENDVSPAGMLTRAELSDNLSWSTQLYEGTNGVGDEVPMPPCEGESPYAGVGELP